MIALMNLIMLDHDRLQRTMHSMCIGNLSVALEFVITITSSQQHARLFMFYTWQFLKV